jgi:hypothetical protein
MSFRLLAFHYFLSFLFIVGFSSKSNAQYNCVTYAGNASRETFYDVTQLSDGSFIIGGYCENLNWISASVPRTQLSWTGNIPNAQGTNRYGFLMQLSADLQNILHVVHFPQGAVEDIRFIKTNTQPYSTTGDLYISCNTSDSDNNNGGYIIAKLNNNFVEGIPTALSWLNVVWAKSGPKDYHPWDVTNDGKVFYISGEAHGYDWSAMYCLDNTGRRTVVNNWRTHWLKNGTEWRGYPASANPTGDIDSVNYSGIVLKSWGRCDLRSWTLNDYNSILPDGNGGTKKGKWPVDVLFNGPCDPQNPSTGGPGYSGYSQEACCPVYGGSNIVVDKRNGNVYIGMNMKSYFNPDNTPDFEPAVIAMDNEGSLLWWSRLYHEITPAGDTVGSIPDQYIDALAIDYAHDLLVVNGRTHGNNTENFWEGNTLAANPQAMGFQNQFTGTVGNIHESWLGKLQLSDGTIMHSTYVAELTDATGSLGTPHPDPNLDGWPDPNTGWPNVNTTRLAKNNLKVSSNGDVCILGVGRRTITTANAYQKMVKPQFGGHSAWNSFVRVYDSELSIPKYSSLVVGVWDTISQAGGSNTELFGLFKTVNGVIAVGRHTADTSNVATGNNLPVINVTPWGNATAQGESAILIYYSASNLYNTNDSTNNGVITNIKNTLVDEITLFPNPTKDKISVSFRSTLVPQNWNYQLIDASGRAVLSGKLEENTIPLTSISKGIYQLNLINASSSIHKKIIVL